MGVTKPFWQHRSNDTFSDFYKMPSYLLNHYDKYYEDFYIGNNSPTPFMLRTAGFRYCSPDYHLVNMNHGGRYAMLFVLSGKGYADGISIKCGDVIFFSHNCQCNFSVDFEDPCVYTWITFKGGNSESMLKEIGLQNNNNTVYHTDNISEIASIFYDMLYVDHEYHNVEMYMDAQLLHILSLSTNKNPASQSDLNIIKQNHINRAIEYISEHFNDKFFCIADVSKAIGISENYLRTLFRAEMGMSIQEYIIEQRLKVAKTLLNSSNYNVSEISEFCGYSDYRQFSKIFKRKIGVPPSKYKHGGN